MLIIELTQVLRIPVRVYPDTEGLCHLLSICIIRHPTGSLLFLGKQAIAHGACMCAAKYDVACLAWWHCVLKDIGCCLGHFHTNLSVIVHKLCAR